MSSRTSGRRYVVCRVACWRSTFGERGSAIVELALVLPLLVVLLVGMWSFGDAFQLKHKLNNAAREGARFGSSEPRIDLNCAPSCPSVPATVKAIRDVVANYLTNAGLTTCSISASAAETGLQWTYSITGCAVTGSLVIDRGFILTVGGIASIGTHVTVKYPYTWQFASVIQLLGASAYATSFTISSDAIMQDLP